MTAFVGNTRYRTMVNGNRVNFVTKKLLPYDAEIEYLESTGTQYIDTKVGVTSTLVTDITLALTNGFTYANISFLFGSYKTGGYCSYSIAAASSSEIRVPDNNSFTNLSASLGSYGTIHTISYKFGSIKFDGTQKGTQIGRASTSIDLRLFGRNSPDSGDAYATKNIRLYSCKLTDGNNLLRDFIPVRVGQVGYLYDKVGRTLYGNSGTGSFTLGPDKN